MISTKTYRFPHWHVSLITTLVILSLLQLTNLNFYLSKLFGFETEINNVGGGAFNFGNYLGSSILIFALLSKLRTLRANWKSAIPIYILIVIYFTSLLAGPYTNSVWILYQFIFLSIALLAHLVIQKQQIHFNEYFKNTMDIFMIGILIFITFCAFKIYLQGNFSYYIEEFNEVFVQTLDDYGIVKQFYGYLLGFVLSYSIFFIKNIPLKLIIFVLVAFTGFGIRSFLIGLAGAAIIYSIHNKKRLILLIAGVIISWFILLQPYFQAGIYDTRFYAYANAFDIVQKFPFGVGIGGYHIYTEEHSRQLFADFYDINSILDYIPLAPESDIVYLFASLGPVLAFLHISIIASIIIKISKTVHIQNSFEKCILFYFCFMTFYGISEDSMFSLNYWVFFGLASGLSYDIYQRYKLKNA